MTSYFAYLASPEWDKRRKVEYDKAKGKCLGCGDKAKNIHHRTYARLGHEAEGDLVALCKQCHLLAHLRHEENRKAGLWEATNLTIHAQRERFGLPAVLLPGAAGTPKAATKAVTPKRPTKQAAQAKRRQRQAKRRQVRWEKFFAETPPERLTPAGLEAARTPAGGWSRKQLAAWGVPWPPPKGWKAHLTGTLEGKSDAA